MNVPASRSSLLRALPLVALTASFTATAASAAPKTVRVHLQVPVNATNPAKTNLDFIEGYGKTPAFSHSFAIPYTTLEKQIRNKLVDTLADEIPQGKNTEVCTDPCPDVAWWIDYTPSFAFTKKGQPHLEMLGSSGDNKFRVEVEVGAKVRVKGKAHATATIIVPPAIPDDKHISVPFDLYVEVNFKARADIDLWPDIEVSNIVIEDEIVDLSPNIELNGAVVELGVTAGFILGSTPLGFASGGPLVFTSLLGVIGDAAADAAEAEIEDRVEAMIEQGFNRAMATARGAISKAIVPATTAINAKKDKALDTKLPGINKSISQLSQLSGITLEPHTVTPNGGLAVSAVARFSATTGTAKINGVARIPRQACVYASVLGHKTLVQKDAANTDLESRVGTSCASALAGRTMHAKLYRGANPQSALGSAADNLPTWTTGGSSSFGGTLTKHADYYQCTFQTKDLPKAAIVELEVREGTKAATDPERFFAYKPGAGTQVFDNQLTKVATPVVGGPVVCDDADPGGPVLTPSKKKEFLDWVNGCPECVRVRKLGSDLIYEVRDLAKFKATALGKHLTSAAKKVKRTKKAPRATRTRRAVRR